MRIGRCTLVALAAAVAALAFGLPAAGAATDWEPTLVVVTCDDPDDNGVAMCRVEASRSFASDEQIWFAVTLPGGGDVTGATGTDGVSGLRPVWCADSVPASMYCYTFTLETDGHQQSEQTPGDGVSVVSDVDDDAATTVPGAEPCPSQPELLCVTEPSGPDVVTIHVTDPEDSTGTSVSIDKNGETTVHSAAGYHQSPQDAEATQVWTDDVDATVDNDDLPVMWAADGTQSEEEQLNKQRLEQELYDAGRPYVVCFEDTTYTRTNSDGTTEEVTVPAGPCVVVTP
ncbi:MAG: hypothetical protein OXI97_01835 [Acidimicrobiaceae bacterium]|nr:hypothetical protein [Acidimicrobiaceae bacterium]